MKDMDKWSLAGYGVLAVLFVMFLYVVKSYMDAPVIQLSTKTGQPEFLRYPDGHKVRVSKGQHIPQYETEFIN